MTTLKTQYETLNFREYWKQALAMIFIFGAIFFTVSAFIPPRYESDASILIVQRDSSGLDAYKETKSAEFSGKVLREIIYSNSFMESVIQSSNGAKAYFDSEKNPEKRLEKWRDNVSIDQVTNTGILNIATYASDKAASKDIISKIIEVLQTQGKSFYGSDQLEIKVINKPYTLESPAYPNLLINTGIGALLGALLMFLGINIFGRSFLIMGGASAKSVNYSNRGTINFKSMDYPEKKPQTSSSYSDEKYFTDFQRKFDNEVKAQFGGTAVEPVVFEKPIAADESIQPMPVKTPKIIEEKKPSFTAERIVPKSTVTFSPVASSKQELKEKPKEAVIEESMKKAPSVKDQESADFETKPQVKEEIPVFVESAKPQPERAIMEKKVQAPENLPFADESLFEAKSSAETEKNDGSKSESTPVTNVVSEKVASASVSDKPTQPEPALEPTDEEIKERLNKLLKGEL